MDASILASLSVVCFLLAARSVAISEGPPAALAGSRPDGGHPASRSGSRRFTWRRSVRRAHSRHRRAVDAEVPQLLDLLAAGSSAGLSAPHALRQAALALRGPLAAELGGAFVSVDLGARWRDELAALAWRVDSADLRRTVSVLARTEVLGSSLSEATRELAVSVRAARRAAVTERARTAPVKMLFPLVFLILPAFLLLTVVPVLLTTVRSIS
jgi:tight adherence protein C